MTEVTSEHGLEGEFAALSFNNDDFQIVADVSDGFQARMKDEFLFKLADHYAESWTEVMQTIGADMAVMVQVSNSLADFFKDKVVEYLSGLVLQNGLEPTEELVKTAISMCFEKHFEEDIKTFEGVLLSLSEKQEIVTAGHCKIPTNH
jgi:hypothetical protein